MTTPSTNKSSAAELIAEAERAGVRLVAAGLKLRWIGPATPELLTDLSRCKREVLAELRSRPAVCDVCGQVVHCPGPDGSPRLSGHWVHWGRCAETFDARWTRPE